MKRGGTFLYREETLLCPDSPLLQGFVPCFDFRLAYVRQQPESPIKLWRKRILNVEGRREPIGDSSPSSQRLMGPRAQGPMVPEPLLEATFLSQGRMVHELW